MYGKMCIHLLKLVSIVWVGLSCLSSWLTGGVVSPPVDRINPWDLLMVMFCFLIISRMIPIHHTVDGKNPANQLVGRLSQYFLGFSTIPGGCLGFLNHQQYFCGIPPKLLVGKRFQCQQISRWCFFLIDLDFLPRILGVSWSNLTIA